MFCVVTNTIILMTSDLTILLHQIYLKLQVYIYSSSFRCLFLQNLVLTLIMSFLLPLQVAVPDVADTTKDADILVFVVPHQFLRPLCKSMKGKIKPGAIGVSLIKVCVEAS